MFPGLDLYCSDPAQHLITAGEDLDDVDYDLIYLVRGMINYALSIMLSIVLLV